MLDAYLGYSVNVTYIKVRMEKNPIRFNAL